MARSHKDSVGGHTRRDIGIYLGGKLCAISWSEDWRRFAKRHEVRRQRRLVTGQIIDGLLDDESMQEALKSISQEWDTLYEEDYDDDWLWWEERESDDSAEPKDWDYYWDYDPWESW